MWQGPINDGKKFESSFVNKNCGHKSLKMAKSEMFLYIFSVCSNFYQIRQFLPILLGFYHSKIDILRSNVVNTFKKWSYGRKLTYFTAVKLSESVKICKATISCFIFSFFIEKNKNSFFPFKFETYFTTLVNWGPGASTIKLFKEVINSIL